MPFRCAYRVGMRRSDVRWLQIVTVVVLLVVATGSCAPSVPSSPPPPYTITALDAIHVTAINNDGVVIGSLSATGNTGKWEQGRVVELTGVAEANAINDAGFIVGITTMQGVAWHDGVVDDLNLSPTSDDRAYDVNANGTVVGLVPQPTADGNHTTYKLVLWSQGVVTTVGTFTSARAPSAKLNGANLITTIIDHGTTEGITVAARWEQGVVTRMPVPSGMMSRPADINDAGQIVGTIVQPDLPWTTNRAFIWQNDEVIILPVLGPDQERTWSSAYGINNQGVVVGTSAGRAVMWQDGVITDLNTFLPVASGWELYYALEINNLGAIIGGGFKDGEFRSFLLTPVELQDD